MLDTRAWLRVIALLSCTFGTTARAQAKANCSSTFEPLSASIFAAALNPGWNPGNTMDAAHGETEWGNPPLVKSTFANVKRAGFQGVRLPVTWTYHMMDSAPWTVDAAWLQRVSDVIDMITSQGLYVLVNAHHDSWASFDLGAENANYTLYEDKFYSLWYQIGVKLGCKSNLVAFEALNEPAGSTVEHAAQLNKLMKIFIKAINDAGGHNAQRVIVLGGLGNNAANTAQWFEPPSKNITNPWAITFHYYSPWDFVANAWGRTFWGSDADKSAVDADFAAFRGNFSDVPVIVGEFGMEMRPSEPAARWKWFDHVVSAGWKYNFTMMLWDASIHFVKDSPDPWQDPTALDILVNAAKGEANVLAESTVDGSATEQFSSAYLWHRVGKPVTDISLPFIWKGRKIRTITSSSTPQPDYYVKEKNITFTANYLSTLFQEDGEPGFKANVSLRFFGGATLQVQAVEWDTPQPAMTDFVVNASNADTDLRIPIEYKGLAKLATVKARMYNSTYLFDEWTQWLGPLQQARLTYQSHWDFDANHVIVKSSVLKAVLAADIATGLTFEFYPRVQGNSVNFTINVVAP